MFYILSDRMSNPSNGLRNMGALSATETNQTGGECRPERRDDIRRAMRRVKMGMARWLAKMPGAIAYGDTIEAGHWLKAEALAPFPGRKAVASPST